MFPYGVESLLEKGHVGSFRIRVDSSMLKGKVAFVTGACRGIGRAIALELARQGADMVAADILQEVGNTCDTIRAMGRRSVAVVMDVSIPEQVQSGFKEATEQLGPIDILVNNAGLVANISPLLGMKKEAWDHEIKVDLSGMFYCVQEVLGPMIERKWGRIINISSMAATQGLAFQAAYSASKAGVLGLTKVIALEHAKDGITCNAVLPGLIGTEQVLAMPREILERAVELNPSGRIGEPEDIAKLVAFLSSEDANYINGVDIHVDGGGKLNPMTMTRKRI